MRESVGSITLRLLDFQIDRYTPHNCYGGGIGEVKRRKLASLIVDQNRISHSKNWYRYILVTGTWYPLKLYNSINNKDIGVYVNLKQNV